MKLGWLFEMAMAAAGGWSCYQTAEAARWVVEVSGTSSIWGCGVPSASARGAFDEAMSLPILMLGAVAFRHFVELNRTNEWRSVFRYKGRLSFVSLGVAIGFYGIASMYISRM